ncbi:putative secreted glycosyl hydrolase [Arcticibacter svalbardensis MN12-7]|uniref:Putative secreted glycosyl hydrolase n=1 Tax=Arcticibacter svalbardensis MN12-7 TaxID=1150600 RepID=R9GW91_9SPHI|nr:DUF1080 domain-containing protein [Arcticibacter svalbardensis]EOR95795.1 putative secreted glycosyl hydrolase [Arcticibacter svalbardensis MN12-7]
MKKVFLTISTLFIIVGITAFNKPDDAENASQVSSPTAAPWKILFDGQSTKGWHSYGQTTTGAAWKVEDGAIHLDAAAKAAGVAGGDLVTDQEYKDFDLMLEWKISANGNSGIIFYVHDDKAKYPDTYNTGLEMQVLDNDGHPDGKIPKHRAGDLYDLISSNTEPVKAVGEWNKAEIVSRKGKLELFLNGTKVVTTTLWDANWKKLVAGSKFASMPDFSIYKSGKIALQDHGNEVWYRNIKIKEL